MILFWTHLNLTILFLLRNSFLVLVIPAMCIISFCLYTNSSAQTFICDNLWSKSLQTSQRPLWVMMSFILTLKGTFAPPPFLLTSWANGHTFHSVSQSEIGCLTYWVTGAWKIRSLYYYVCSGVFRNPGDGSSSLQSCQTSSTSHFTRKELIALNSLLSSPCCFAASEIISTW